MRRNRRPHWIRHTHLFDPDEYECSACGYRAEKPYRICPHCGRKMKQGRYDPSWVDEMEILDILSDC